MTTNKEKFLALVTEHDATVAKEIEYRVQNRAWLKESFMVGIKVLLKLDELNWTQKDLAAAMNVSPQQVNKIVRGKQNLTLETLVRLQDVLNIPILASFYEIKHETINKYRYLISIDTKRRQTFISEPWQPKEITRKSLKK